MIAKLILYPVLIIPFSVLIVSIIECNRRKQRPTGWQCVATVVLAIVLFIFLFFDTGEVFKYWIQSENGYCVSPRAIEQIILKNIDDLGLAVARVYEKYYIVEKFDCSGESDVVKFGKDNDGRVYFKLKLKYQPVENTIGTLFSSGFPIPSEKEPNQAVGSDLFYKIFAKNYTDIDGLKRWFKEVHQITEVKYFRKK